MRHISKFLMPTVDFKYTALDMLQKIYPCEGKREVSLSHLVGWFDEFHFCFCHFHFSASGLWISLSSSPVLNHASFDILNFIWDCFPQWIPEHQGWPKKRGQQFSIHSKPCMARPLSFAIVLCCGPTVSCHVLMNTDLSSLPAPCWTM